MKKRFPSSTSKPVYEQTGFRVICALDEQSSNPWFFPQRWEHLGWRCLYAGDGFPFHFFNLSTALLYAPGDGDYNKYVYYETPQDGWALVRELEAAGALVLGFDERQIRVIWNSRQAQVIYEQGETVHV